MSLALFDGALAVVTGAGGGFGRATALALAERGATVVAADIDREAAERTVVLAKALGAVGRAYEVDVSDTAAMEEFAAAVRSDHRVPDIVVNNAGVAVSGPLLDTGVDEWERILGVNLWGVIHGSRLFAKQMVERVEALPNRPDKPNFGGHIVNVASAAAFAPTRALPAYCTTKAGVLMLSECLRAELAGHRIGVTAVCPGFSKTGIMRNGIYVGVDAAGQERQRARADKLLRLRNYPPEKVAERIVHAIVKNKAVVPVNAEAHVMHALSRIAPSAVRAIARIPAPLG
ncbi:SDR family NAD(P)-dependent oxidoreductase [Spirillospora sp. NPDC049652]